MSKELRFEKAAFGYRPEDVDRVLEEMERKMAAMQEEKNDLQGKLKILADKINEYRSEESNLKDALLEAQRMKNAIENAAGAKAEAVVADAQSRADKIVADAQKTAEETIGGIHIQVEREKNTLAQMQKEVSAFKAKLIALYKEHLNLITNLPEAEKEPEAKEEKTPVFTDPAPAAPVYTPSPVDSGEEFNSAAFAEKFGEVKLDQ